METLNLNTLASSLPTAQQNAEKELLNNFKAAALSITTLYRSSRQNAKRAYNTGYAAACQDLLTMIQQGVSVDGLGSPAPGGPSETTNSEGIAISRVMDWIEARLEAIKAEEEDEEEEEEREKEKERNRTTTGIPSSQLHSKAAPGPPPSSNTPLLSLPTPNSPAATNANQLPSEPTSPSPPLLPSNTLRPSQRVIKPRASKGESAALPPSSVFNLPQESVTSIHSPMSFAEAPSIPAVGAKRRHAVMMMLDATAPTTPSAGNASVSHSTTSISASPVSHSGLSGTTRRRMKNARGSQQIQNQNINVIQSSTEAMDIEDEGRERKRVARR